jgi:hypothetical protein
MPVRTSMAAWITDAISYFNGATVVAQDGGPLPTAGAGQVTDRKENVRRWQGSARAPRYNVGTICRAKRPEQMK